VRFQTGSRVHFIGIGGAGMSAIAKVLLERGVLVSGSDLKPSRAAAMLEAMGARVHIGHDADLIEDGQVVVVSSAIPASNPELRRAEELELEVLARGEALAALLEGFRSIVVAGTHGKTTTTSMAATILRGAGLDPTYLIGGGLNDVGTNAKFGSAEFAVAESDESDGSFLLLAPHIGVITNVELDHVDRWGSLDELYDAFRAFIDNIDADGSVVVPAADAVLVGLAASSGRRVVTFDDGGDVGAEDLLLGPQRARFRLVTPRAHGEVSLRVPGRHNVSNALAAAAACLAAGVDVSAAASGLSAYRGVERRLQVRGRSEGVTVIDDYAHHPTEIQATLAAVRPGPWGRVVAVFQPHRYSRTAALATGFGASFEDADRVVVTDVYGAGEQPVPGVTGKLVSDAVCTHIPGRPVAYLPHRADLIEYLTASTRSGDVVLTLGAGDITNVGEELLARLNGAL
jgi:UDP-N-acetylmuramate--alanine ligase